MPLYRYKCECTDVFGTYYEKILPIAERDKPMECQACFSIVRRILDAPGAVYAPTSKGGLAT